MSQLVVGSRNIWILESFRPFEMDASAGSFLPPRAQRIRKVRDDRIKVEGLTVMAVGNQYSSGNPPAAAGGRVGSTSGVSGVSASRREVVWKLVPEISRLKKRLPTMGHLLPGPATIVSLYFPKN
jgi:hypothetical protein